MKAFLTVITAGALTMSAVGQSVSTMSFAGSELNGTDLVAELNKSVNSKKAKPGEQVKATLTQDVLAHGKIVIRRGSKLVGHVTEAKPRSKEDQESRLGLVFDKAVLKGGQEIDFSAAVRALAPPVRYGAVDKPDMMGPPVSGMGNQSNNPQPISNGPGGGGGLSGRGSSSSTATNTATNQASRAAQYATASIGSSSLPEGGVMGGGSRGVFGMPGLKLGPPVKGQEGSVISSTRHDVKLESGTQLVIQVTTK
ncbi:MAG TPA: hypothetical protein VI685_21475 [Candidatus Angelobacter sp.]